MQGTRERILELLVERREARVEDLSETLGITTAAVRRHLDNLRADGLADVRAVKQPTGRPFYVYFATERARGVIPTAYVDLMARMMRTLGERSEVVSEVAASLADRHRGEIEPHEGDIALRVVQVTESLRHDGILDSWRAETDGFHLVNGICPYLRAAEISRLPCDSDKKAIELLMGGDVEQVHRIVDGASCCEYIVRTAPAAAPEELSKGAS